MKITPEEINNIIKDFVSDYECLHPLTELVEYDDTCYLSIHHCKLDSDKKINAHILEERIKNLVQVYGECDLIKETSGNTSNTVFDVYKLIPNGY